MKLFKSNVDKFNLGKYDLIVSNPPYLSLEDYKNAPKSIKYHEPKIALFGGMDGLYFYKKFARTLPNLLKPRSHLILEIGENQATNCKKIFKDSGLYFPKKSKDLQKKDRILIFCKI